MNFVIALPELPDPGGWIWLVGLVLLLAIARRRHVWNALKRRDLNVSGTGAAPEIR